MSFTIGHGELGETLQQVEVPVIDNDICNQEDWYGDRRVSNNQLCAGYESGEKDSCKVHGCAMVALHLSTFQGTPGTSFPLISETISPKLWDTNIAIPQQKFLI